METSLSMKINTIVREMRDGLTPEVLADWYEIVQGRVEKLCPRELRGRITVEQDTTLPMKFSLKISKRTVPFVLNAIEQTMPEMPYSTRLYFEKVQEIILEESVKARLTYYRYSGDAQ